MVIDTSSLSIHQLSTKLYEAMLGSGPSTVAVHIFSFGFNTGCRWTPISWRTCGSCRTHSGADAARAQRARQARQRLRAVKSGRGRFPGRIRAGHPRGVGSYAHEDKHFVTIAIGCTGGQHRSVVMSEELARRLRAHGISVTVSAASCTGRAHSETVQPLCKHFVSIIRQHRVFLSK